MSAEVDQAAVSGAVLNGQYEWVQRKRAASFLGKHPQIVPLLEDLRCRISAAFPRARLVLRHLSSPRVSSPDGDGHLLVVIVPVVPTDDPSGQLSDLLREWAPEQAAARAYLLVDVASDVVDPFAGDDDAVMLYVRRRSDDYKQYLDVAHRFLKSPPDSDERALAAAELSTARLRARGRPAERHGGEPHEVLARLRRQRKAATDAG
jgi:hypothetical protein